MAIDTQDMPWLASGPAVASEKTMRVEVVMKFRLRGVTQEIGSVLTLPEPLAREMIGYRKVIRCPAPAIADTVAEAETDPAPVPKSKAPRKSKE